MAAETHVPGAPIKIPFASQRRFPTYGYVGAAIVALAEACLVADVPLVATYFTPLSWTGYILVVDAFLWRSRVRDKPFWRSRELLFMAAWSLVCWLIFEAFNLRLQNWTYVGLPDNVVARLAGFAWSFATIFPAILLTSEFINSKLHFRRPQFSFAITQTTVYTSMIAGGVMLVIPLVLSQEIGSQLFALVWVGFVFLLDPVNHVRGRKSILSDLARGNVRILASLLLSGLLCGLLWEFWNYWAGAKWIYTVPISFAGPKVFEMPLLGFLGFLPFAVECYAMNEILYSLFPSLQVRMASTT